MNTLTIPKWIQDRRGTWHTIRSIDGEIHRTTCLRKTPIETHKTSTETPQGPQCQQCASQHTRNLAAQHHLEKARGYLNRLIDEQKPC